MFFVPCFQNSTRPNNTNTITVFTTEFINSRILISVGLSIWYITWCLENNLVYFSKLFLQFFVKFVRNMSFVRMKFRFFDRSTSSSPLSAEPCIVDRFKDTNFRHLFLKMNHSVYILCSQLERSIIPHSRHIGRVPSDQIISPIIPNAKSLPPSDGQFRRKPTRKIH